MGLSPSSSARETIEYVVRHCFGDLVVDVFIWEGNAELFVGAICTEDPSPQAKNIAHHRLKDLIPAQVAYHGAVFYGEFDRDRQLAELESVFRLGGLQAMNVLLESMETKNEQAASDRAGA